MPATNYPWLGRKYIDKTIQFWGLKVHVRTLLVAVEFSGKPRILLCCGEGIVSRRSARTKQAQFQNSHYLVLMAFVEIDRKR